LAVGLFAWTILSLVASFMKTFKSLFALRCFGGIGEGTYCAIGPAIIADCNPYVMFKTAFYNMSNFFFLIFEKYLSVTPEIKCWPYFTSQQLLEGNLHCLKIEN